MLPKVVFLAQCQTCRNLDLSAKDREEELWHLVRHPGQDQVNHSPRGQGLDQAVHLGDPRDVECLVRGLSQECAKTFLLSSKVQALLQ